MNSSWTRQHFPATFACQWIPECRHEVNEKTENLEVLKGINEKEAKVLQVKSRCRDKFQIKEGSFYNFHRKLYALTKSFLRSYWKAQRENSVSCLTFTLGIKYRVEKKFECYWSGGKEKREGNLLLFSIFPIKLVLRKIFPRGKLQAIVPWNWVQPATVDCVKCDEKRCFVRRKSCYQCLFRKKRELFRRHGFPHQQILIVSSSSRIIMTCQPHPLPSLVVFQHIFPFTGYYQSSQNVIITFPISQFKLYLFLKKNLYPQSLSFWDSFSSPSNVPSWRFRSGMKSTYIMRKYNSQLLLLFCLWTL